MATDKQTPDTVADRAAARRDRVGYDLDSVEDWETGSGTWYDAGDVTPSALSATAAGAGGAWQFDADTFGSRSVGVHYNSAKVYFATDARRGDLRVGFGCDLSTAEARDLGGALFAAGKPTNTEAGERVSTTFTPGSASASTQAPGLSWSVDGSDITTTVSVARGGVGVCLDVEAIGARGEARLAVELTPAEAQELGAAIYQAAEDSELLTELDGGDTDAATGGA